MGCFGGSVVTSRKTSVQRTHKRKADVLFSQHIRSVGKCERCGTSRSLQCAHWISRRYAWTRTDPRNAFCLCAGCHRYFTDRPTEFSDWALEQRGRGTWLLISQRSFTRDKFDWVAEYLRLSTGPTLPVQGPMESELLADYSYEANGFRFEGGWRTEQWLERRYGDLVDSEWLSWVWDEGGHQVTVWKLL